MLEVVRRIDRTEVVVAGGLLVLAGLAVGARPVLLGLAWLAVVTPRLIAVDVAEHRLPDAIVLPGYPVVLAAVLVDALAADGEPGGAVLAGLAYGALILLLHVAGGMGFGDVKLAPLLGALVATAVPGGAVVAVVLAFLAGGGAAAVVLLRHGARARMPFGPPMLLGAWAAILLLA